MSLRESIEKFLPSYGEGFKNYCNVSCPSRMEISACPPLLRPLSFVGCFLFVATYSNKVSIRLTLKLKKKDQTVVKNSKERAKLNYDDGLYLKEPPSILSHTVG